MWACSFETLAARCLWQMESSGLRNCLHEIRVQRIRRDGVALGVRVLIVRRDPQAAAVVPEKAWKERERRDRRVEGEPATNMPAMEGDFSFAGESFSEDELKSFSLPIASFAVVSKQKYWGTSPVFSCRN